MEVKKIIENVANFMDIPEILECRLLYGENVETEEEKEICNLLMKCLNQTNEIIATEYYLLKDVAKINSNGKINYNLITNKKLHSIEKIEKDGLSLNFKCYPQFIETEPGNVTITYNYLPQMINSFNEIINDYPLKITERIFAYGVVAEYNFVKGIYDDATMWDSRFKSSLINVIKHKKNIKIPKRLWV